MKSTRQTLPILILAALLTSPALALAEESLLDKAKETTSKGWEATKKGIEDAAEWSKEKSSAAWDVTKEGASDATEWTKEKADQALNATRKGVDALKKKEEDSAEEDHRDSPTY